MGTVPATLTSTWSFPVGIHRAGKGSGILEKPPDWRYAAAEKMWGTDGAQERKAVSTLAGHRIIPQASRRGASLSSNSLDRSRLHCSDPRSSLRMQLA